MNLSDDIAWSDIYGYYNPVTFEAISDSAAPAMIQSAHQAGLVVDGIDNAVVDSLPVNHAVTIAENQANLNEAAAQAAEELGLTDFQRTNWSADQRVNYMNRFKAIILQNPDMFTAQTVNTAHFLNVSDLGNASLSTAANFGVWITDAIATAAHQAAASVPGQATSAILDTVKGMTDALSSFGKSIGSLSFLMPFAIAFFGYLAIKSIGADPGGQAKKVISSFV